MPCVRGASRAHCCHRTHGNLPSASAAACPQSGGIVSGSGGGGASESRSQSNSLGPNLVLPPETEHGELGHEDPLLCPPRWRVFEDGAVLVLGCRRRTSLLARQAPCSEVVVAAAVAATLVLGAVADLR